MVDSAAQGAEFIRLFPKQVRALPVRQGNHLDRAQALSQHMALVHGQLFPLPGGIHLEKADAVKSSGRLCHPADEAVVMACPDFRPLALQPLWAALGRDGQQDLHALLPAQGQGGHQGIQPVFPLLRFPERPAFFSQPHQVQPCRLHLRQVIPNLRRRTPFYIICCAKNQPGMLHIP